MSSPKKSLAFLVLSTVGIWGCAQESGTADRVKALESTNAQLENDFRTATAARDQARKRLAAVEEHFSLQVNELQLQIQALGKERDELELQLTLRTAERDSMVGQYEQFRKGIRELLGQAEAAMNRSAGQSVTAVGLNR